MMNSYDRLSAVREQMRKAGIRAEDVEEEFIHSPGKGGQFVNKVATCVCLLHRPSGIRIKCHQERSQLRNRILARQILLSRIRERRRQVRRQRAQQKARARRQRRLRPAHIKEEMLQSKKRRAQKKGSRRKIDMRQIDPIC